jgi:hypothetical protein
MIKLVFPDESLANLAATLRGHTQESLALLLARPVRLGRDPVALAGEFDSFAGAR